jgi:flavin-dependent thymidylate synthase
LTSNEVVKWADKAMYEAEPYNAEDGPRVTLLSMTKNPLRVMAAAAEMYRGHVIRNPSQISRSQAEAWLKDMLRTSTRAPMEYVDFHFLFEGVTRAFTHQLVRQRTAVYVQESMRFAVKGHAMNEVAMPPSIYRLKEDAPARVIWEGAVRAASEAYGKLVNAGIPAEDARGILPTNITTRVHYKTNLRNLMDHAGMRLCSQAQYEWKQVWNGIIFAIRNEPMRLGPLSNDFWQYDAIAALFKPVCYQTGKCEFMASTDRACRIRDRVQAHAEAGDAPSTWTDINPLEPLLEGAARVAPGAREAPSYYDIGR